jgi:RecA/RadA recombinase
LLNDIDLYTLSYYNTEYQEKYMSLIDRLKKNSTIKDTEILNRSKFFNAKDMIQTSVPMVNVALSGRLDGGLTPGLTVFAGPSKHFKTAFALLLAKSYLEKYDDGVVLFYDSEFGSPQSYFDSFGIDTEKVIHTPITDIEQLKHDAMAQLSNIDRGDHVIIIVDSVGNLASKKEVEDALEGKSVADMSRAKQLKSLFRMVTPHLTIKDIPMVVVNHTYKEIGMFPKDVVSGGCVIEGTLIHTPQGLKAIQDFVVGDKVMTISGEKLVTHVWCPETLENGTPECYEIEFEDGYKVVCSDKHKFLINNRWVEAKDLRCGDDVSVV